MERDRSILRISGPDAEQFLQGLITNDIDRLEDGLVYTALLSPQGKYIADFFLVRDGANILLDANVDQASGLMARLGMYKLRASVEIETSPLHMHRGLGDIPTDAYADPRNPELGWRAYRSSPMAESGVDWDALRVMHTIPGSGIELTPDSYILEYGFERLNGVDFRKGCYVGQEITARMKHKTELRKGLATVGIKGAADPGTAIVRNDKIVGTLFTQSGKQALAYLRFDRVGDGMHAGDAVITLSD